MYLNSQVFLLNFQLLINGVYIDLDIEYIPYQKLIYDTEKYLNRHTKY